MGEVDDLSELRAWVERGGDSWTSMAWLRSALRILLQLAEDRYSVCESKPQPALKSCAHCGGVPELRFFSENGTTYVYVRCSECTSQILGHFLTCETAAGVWNRRV